MASKRDVTIKRRRAVPQEQAAQEPKAAPKKKRRRQRSVIWPVLFRLLLVAALVMLGVLVWRNWDRLAPTALTEWFDQKVTGGASGEGYPVAITGSSVLSMEAFNSDAALLTDTSVLIYNTSGALLTERSHTYADPMLRTAGNYLLVAELGGERYTLGTRKETVCEGTAGNTIRSASVDASGQVALAVRSSQSYMSEVVVKSRAGKEIFHWYSVDLTVVDVALSANGKRVAVLGLSAEGGEMKSTLLIFRLSGKKDTAEYTFSAVGPMMTSLHYYGNDNVAAVGDTAVWVCSPGDKEPAVLPFENATLLGYAFSERGIGVVTRGFGESRGGTLSVMTPAGKKGAQVDFTGDFRHLAAADNGFYLLTDTTLYSADTVGFAKQTAVASDGLQVVEMNGRPLLLGLTQISRCSWKSD